MKPSNHETILIIDTSNSEETVVGLKINGKRDFLKGKSKILKAQNALPLIEKILKKHKIKTSDLTAIKVNTGPGSFTGLRVGVAVANALAWVLKIPVNGKKLVEPKY
ncbi:tRNA (adenosine(37)-N6)-threonylcarbamoyltransferase complex dimerization subunit type 1 TsaB [Candidatus Microgenomates bacterium]|nr:tRNA (adenosine(37)-N6)-threonylcarbamoyltransferase complex dimerization subunit type 1 TsaB [Candidatus Microgenomates bacterium]